MKTKYATGFAAALLLLPLSARSADPVVVHVSTTTQLIAAVDAANLRAAQTIIEVAPKQYKFAQVRHNRYGRSALPLIKSNIVIRGQGAQTTIFDNATLQSAGERLGRFFTVGANGLLLVSGITITHGFLDCESEAECPGETALKGGSAAANFGGELTLDNCLITDNGASDFNGALGGALYNEGGKLTIKRSTVSNNKTVGSGAALVVRGGTVLIQNSNFRGNETLPPGAGNGTFVLGGAIAALSGQLTILASTFSGNVVGIFDDEPLGHGGAIFNLGTLTIRNSSIIENTAMYRGFGGGIYNAGTTTIDNSTLGGNISGTFGGAIYNEGVLTLRGVTIAGNESQNAQRTDLDCSDFSCPEGGGGIWNAAQGTFNLTGGRTELSSSVIANNSTAHTGPDCAGSLISKSYNALGNSADCDLQRSTADKTDLNVRIGELRENGVAGRAYFPVLQGSPLIDRGGPFPGRCSARDQLGHARRDGNGDGVIKCDIGAIEF